MTKIVIDADKCPLRTLSGVCKIKGYNCFKTNFIPDFCPLKQKDKNKKRG